MRADPFSHAMLLVVKKEDGLHVVVLSHIEVCNVATIASDPNRRLVAGDCLDHLTIDQAKVMVERLGSSITGKDIRDVLEMHWLRIQERAMSISRFFIPSKNNVEIDPSTTPNLAHSLFPSNSWKCAKRSAPPSSFRIQA